MIKRGSCMLAVAIGLISAPFLNGQEKPARLTF
jgi:hypothetical protein